ncbi:MAG: DUF3830 family protein [Pseudomonadota bacterium]|nr:DUF3830 family protein [Pseudomonadota bacterium]
MAVTKTERELLAAYAAVWPQPISRGADASTLKLTLEVHGFAPFCVRLLDGVAPMIAEALLAKLPFEGRLIHSAWSGSGVRALEPMELPGVTAHENSTFFPVPGDLCYTVGHAEFTLFYGDASPAMASGPVRESVFGVIEDDLLSFQQACMLTRLSGLRTFMLRFD